MTLQLFPLSNAKLDDDFNPFNKILNDTDTQIKWRSGDQKTASFGSRYLFDKQKFQVERTEIATIDMKPAVSCDEYDYCHYKRGSTDG